MPHLATEIKSNFMNRLLLILILFFSCLTIQAQADKKDINSKFIQFYPIDFPEAFIERPLYGKIATIDISKNDTINYQVQFDKKRISSIVFDSTKMNFSYRFGRLARIENLSNDFASGKTKIYKILPFVFAFKKGHNHIGFHFLGKTCKMRYISGFKTIDKRKAKYRNGRVVKIKDYQWNTIAQRCYFWHYDIIDYPNDTTVVKRSYDANDSLAFETEYIYDMYGNPMEINTLARKRQTGWGIDVTYYAYDANETYQLTYNYKFDKYHNWIEKYEYSNDTLQSKEIRKIIYIE
jgi:hypothetical protein